MGFATDQAVTTNDDLLKYAFEQQVANLLRQPGASFTSLHQGAVNDLMRRLRSRGYSTAQIAGVTNIEDWKPALVSWVLSKIFAGQGGRTPAERDAALGKAGYYAAEYEKLVANTVAVLADATEKEERGLPVGVNVDAGTMYPALGSPAPLLAPWRRPAHIGEGVIPGYDDLMIEGQ
ncbi:MAG TPA: hypothetical protein VHF22_02800 [Planctomycetota bacterium]|nr:hypothetical protein [Planctomycetota bacterium]